MGITCTLVGHSERRSLYAETDSLLIKKTVYCLNKDMKVVFCCGEQLADRESNNTEQVIKTQIESLKALDTSSWKNLVIAYEPVWAIGTGKVASPEQAQEAHRFIRQWVTENVSEAVAQQVRIIYGGSVKEANCQNLIKMQDIDGFLIGGASLKASFAEIVKMSS